jgi:2-polyprenyl-3-methyl-5-hydroxy-6-metoxy-1,4-benzoquinol methylase
MNRKERRAAGKPGAGTQPNPFSWPPGPVRQGPPPVDVLLEQGRALRARGDGQSALMVACRAILMEETSATRAFFVRCVSDFSYFPGAEAMLPVLARAVREAWAWPVHLLGVALGVLQRDRLIGPALRRAVEASHGADRPLSGAELLGPGGLASIAGHPLLLAVLESVLVPERSFERFLTMLRSAILDAAAEPPDPDGGSIDGLAAALAQQCFINEYIFAVTDEESARVRQLRETVTAALDGGAPVAPLQLAALAAYGRLDLAPELRKQTQPKSLSALLHHQVEEPEALQRMRAEIPRLTPITREVSQAVRQQYEESPYPRWVKAPAAVTPVPVATYLRHVFPHQNVTSPGGRGHLEVLVAGCGTGKQPVEYAQTFSSVKILAIDLSLSSLAYARTRTAAAGLTNISYAQADILELGSLGRSFDLVMSGGVLHHLAEPLEGWRVLTKLTRPNGLMHIALYSEFARRGVVAARRWIAERGFRPAADDIRACRQEMLRIGDPAWQSLMALTDFFSMSECRDLLFHVQEHRFTLLQIAAFLAENNLKFLGFIAPGNVMMQFRARFPAPQQLSDLACWHAFETANPDAFINMYNFWVQKQG